MSALETVFWHVLGYSAMVMIFVVGFAITVAVACVLLDLLGRGGAK
jgi:uncharacterized protein (TIGR02808 family)